MSRQSMKLNLSFACMRRSVGIVLIKEDFMELKKMGIGCKKLVKKKNE